jgi:hypothetical protein
MDQCHEPDAVWTRRTGMVLFQHDNLDGSSMLMGRCDWLLRVATIVILNLEDLRAPAQTNTLVRIRL